MYFTRNTLHVASAMAASLLLAVAGCGTGASAPRTYPVQGRLQYKDGTPVTSGVIEFVAQGEPVTARGEIGGDGSFVLETLFSGAKQKGAVAGKYRVTYIPVQGPQQREVPVILPNLYAVEPQDQNVIVIEIDRPKKN